MPRQYNKAAADDRRGDRVRAYQFSATDTSGSTVSLPSKVTPELKEWVKQHAEMTGKSASQIVREALELYRESVKSE